MAVASTRRVGRRPATGLAAGAGAALDRGIGPFDTRGGGRYNKRVLSG
ncbi:MAG: hypothetical protein HSCHL_1834 [Hydrogenibacillus schlegelii]|uniref:Uncharacterized protein n=1 Tax=Hydrogenibacillus schlegelii TaxID=1484 RepID=A0A2T5GFC7_HYDSH|nr:MAG: hypothetical protein HSCHL_1834 [Hydrogenibacillus schlegelii]